MPFAIQVAPRAKEHLTALRKRDQQIIADAMRVQLAKYPDRVTRNRKRLEDNPLAPWELRVGRFHVFYDIDLDKQQVVVVAVGEKIHNVLRIGDEEIQL